MITKPLVSNILDPQVLNYLSIHDQQLKLKCDKKRQQRQVQDEEASILRQRIN